MSKSSVIILAFDAGMEEQGYRAIRSILQHWSISAQEICVLDLGITLAMKTKLLALNEEPGNFCISFVDAARVTGQIPCWSNAPNHVRAMTCRPYLRDLVPSYDTYMWMDADVRIESKAALATYFHLANEKRLACVQETDPSYVFMRMFEAAIGYHSDKRKRMRDVYGPGASLMQDMVCWNAGIWAMHATSPMWRAYTVNLQTALRTPYDRLKEQDAFNMAIVQVGAVSHVHTLPCMYNWLCSCAAPNRNPESSRLVRPLIPHELIHVLHFTCSGQPSGVVEEATGKKLTYYDTYVRVGLERTYADA